MAFIKETQLHTPDLRQVRFFMTFTMNSEL